jgi:hypothetical protein
MSLSSFWVSFTYAQQQPLRTRILGDVSWIKSFINYVNDGFEAEGVRWLRRHLAIWTVVTMGTRNQFLSIFWSRALL